VSSGIIEIIKNAHTSIEKHCLMRGNYNGKQEIRQEPILGILGKSIKKILRSQNLFKQVLQKILVHHHRQAIHHLHRHQNQSLHVMQMEYLFFLQKN